MNIFFGRVYLLFAHPFFWGGILSVMPHLYVFFFAPLTVVWLCNLNLPHIHSPVLFCFFIFCVVILFSLCCCLFLHHHHHHPASPFFSLSCCSLLIWLCNLNLPLPFCFYFLRCSFIFTLLLPTRYFPFLLPFPPFHFKITHCCFLWRELALVTCFVACTHTRCFFLWCALTSIAFLCVTCTRTHCVDSWHALARNFFLWRALTRIAIFVMCTHKYCFFVRDMHSHALCWFVTCTRTHFFFVAYTCTHCFCFDVHAHALIFVVTHCFNLWRALTHTLLFCVVHSHAVLFLWCALARIICYGVHSHALL